MTQVNSPQKFTGSFQSKVANSSLNETIKSVFAHDKPLTLRQLSGSGIFDRHSVAATLLENTRSGALATFKVGPITYYASPYAALTSKGPTFSSFANEFVKNALWEGKHRVNSLTAMVFDIAGG